MMKRTSKELWGAEGLMAGVIVKRMLQNVAVCQRLVRRTCMCDAWETLQVTHIVLGWCGHGQSLACVGASASQTLLLL